MRTIRRTAAFKRDQPALLTTVMVCAALSGRQGRNGAPRDAGTSGKRRDARCRPETAALRVAPRRPPAASQASTVIPDTLFGPLLTDRAPERDAGRDRGEKCGQETREERPLRQDPGPGGQERRSRSGSRSAPPATSSRSRVDRAVEGPSRLPRSARSGLDLSQARYRPSRPRTSGLPQRARSLTGAVFGRNESSRGGAGIGVSEQGVDSEEGEAVRHRGSLL